MCTGTSPSGASTINQVKNNIKILRIGPLTYIAIQKACFARKILQSAIDLSIYSLTC